MPELTPYTGPWGTQEVVHLLKRTMYGATKSDIDHFQNKSLSEAVDELVNSSYPMPSPPIKDYTVDMVGGNPSDTNIVHGTTWINDNNQDPDLQHPRRKSFEKWWVGLLLNQERSIREKMTMFWHNHFATSGNEVGIAVFIYRHHTLLRENSTGNFKELFKAVTTDAAMLIYLSGIYNTNFAPNENYAREMQELFTVGKENNPNFTEDDVKAAAKVLTGWETDWQSISVRFNQNNHDTGNKQFSSFYGNTVIPGLVGSQAGPMELDDLVNMIFNKSVEVSIFLVKKIYRWFCYYSINENISTNVIEPLAQIFRDSNWEIKPVLSALLKSDHFYDIEKRGAMIKSPIELVVGLMREFKVQFPDPSTSYFDAYNMWEYVFANPAQNMNQAIGALPNVAGWPAYYQHPGYYRLWINSNTYTQRSKFVDQFLFNGYTKNGATINFNAIAFAQSLPNPGDPNKLIDDSLNILFSISLSAESRQTIKDQVLLTNQNDYYWTNAWNAYLANPGDEIAYKTVSTRLISLFKYFMNLSEYQLQ